MTKAGTIKVTPPRHRPFGRWYGEVVLTDSGIYLHRWAITRRRLLKKLVHGYIRWTTAPDQTVLSVREAADELSIAFAAGGIVSATGSALVGEGHCCFTVKDSR